MLSQLLASLRVPSCLLGVLLMAGSFRLAALPILPVILCTIFFVGMLTMIQNDWIDRYHDLKSGRTLAAHHPKLFLSWLLVFYLISAVFLVWSIMLHPMMGVAILAMSVLSVSYSLSYRVPFLAALWVGVIGASPALLPIVVSRISMQNIQLFLATLLFVFGREILKDIDDMDRDKGYKWTMPVAFGKVISLKIAWILISAGGILVLTISYMSVLAFLPIMLGLMRLREGKLGSKTRVILDVGVAMAICLFIIFPPVI